MEDFTFHPALHGFAPHQSNLSPITHHPSFHHLNHFFAVQTRFRGLQLRNGGQFQAALQAAKKLVSLLHSCLVWPAWQQATARKLCTFVDIQFIQSEVRPQGCSLPKIDKIFFAIHTHRHTHTFWLLRLELKLLAKQMILLAPLQPACPRQGTSWT